jgi:hypothetical protein
VLAYIRLVASYGLGCRHHWMVFGKYSEILI